MSAINTENNASPDKALTQAELALKTVQDVLHNGQRVIGLQKYEDFMISPFNRSAFLSSLSRGENLVTNRWKISKDSRTFGGAMKLLEWFRMDAAYKGLEFSYRLANDHISATRKPVNNCHITFTYTKKTDEGNVVMALGLTHYMDNDSVGFALAHDPEISFPNVNEILDEFAIRLDSVVTLLNVVKGEVVARQIKVNINKQRAHDAFYPFIEDGIENLRDQFLASKSNVLTFTGIHGSGKSTLARYIGSSLETTRLFIVSDPSIYVDPNNMALIMQYIYNLLGELDESDEDDEEKAEHICLLLEEADAHVQEKDSTNYALPQILNMTSGAVDLNIKVMILTNLHNSGKLDENLTRDGRTFLNINFPYLTKEEANAARASINLSPIDFTDETVTLAQALNSNATRNLAEKSRQTGFF